MTVIITLYIQDYFKKNINLIKQIFYNQKIFIIDRGNEKRRNIAENTDFSYYYCENDIETIALYNEILNENDKTEGDVLLMDESALQSVNINKSFIKELYDVLYYTEKHGFVSPRIGYSDDPGYLLTQLKKIPRYSLLFHPDIRCILIKKRVIDLLVNFSANYTSLAYSFLDFIQRANYFGFNIVQSNRIFLSCSENHFNNTANHENDRKLFLKRHPYYTRIQKGFHLAYERHAIDNFFSLFSKKNNKKKILLNYFIMPCMYCGTSEYQLNFLEAFFRLFNNKYDIYIYINRPADKFHHLSDRYPNVLFPDTVSGVFDLGFCAHQPFDIDDHFFMNKYCLKSVYSMLDIIMLRCDYIIQEYKNLIIDDVVRFGFRACDGIISISDFSAEDYKAYFYNEALIQNKPFKRVYIASNFTSSPQNKYNTPFKEYYLIAGNHYRHKGVIETVRYAENSNNNFIAIMGMSGDGYISRNIYAYKSGNISEEFIGYLYINCKAVIFPSIYEGFGLPVAIALKNKKRVILYNNSINNELVGHFHEFREYFLFFDKFSQINGIINAIDFSKELPPVEYNDKWDQTAVEIEAFFGEILNTETDFNKLNERWHLLNFLEAKLKETDNLSKNIKYGNKIKITLKKALRGSFPKLYLIIIKIKQKINGDQTKQHIKRLISGNL